MQLVRFGHWEITCDSETTRKAYASAPVGGPEKCGCKPCLNFAAARPHIYPAEALALFQTLGISHDREVEVYHMARLAPGKHLYGGWFHFAGSILSGADAAKRTTENAWQLALEPINEDFSLGFSTRLGLVRKPFDGLSLVQLEFQAKTPWVLPSAEPT